MKLPRRSRRLKTTMSHPRRISSTTENPSEYPTEVCRIGMCGSSTNTSHEAFNLISLVRYRIGGVVRNEFHGSLGFDMHEGLRQCPENRFLKEARNRIPGACLGKRRAKKKEGRVAMSTSAFQFDSFADGPHPLASRRVKGHVRISNQSLNQQRS